ncbi:unnamed protein product [Mytilus edulis]|uniref:Uncharacterized protein n=1 Tax=Mytilus edulis TaxID=6550 RepID=A0A8S3UKM2_MYTED|nr:unnamed protein product [Mytilus edulis]
MDDVDNPFQQLEAAKKQLIMEFKENAKSAQELEFWNRMEIVRDNYPNSQEDSSSGDTTDEEQVDGENLNKGKKTDEKVPDTSDEKTKQNKSAAGERADEEKGLTEPTVKFQIPEMEHGAGDDTSLPQKDFIFQNDGMEHDFSQNATRGESLINLFENKDDNGLGALQLTEDKLEINETDNKNVSAENGYKVGIKDLFKAAKKTAKRGAKESEKKRKLKEKEEKKKRKMEARETERKRKLEEIESKKKMKMEAQESKEKKAREEKEIKKKRKIDKKKAKNQKKYERCVSKGEEYDSKQRWKEETKSSQEKIISEAKQSKQKKKIDQNESKKKGEHKSIREKLIIEIKERNGKVVKEKKELKAKKPTEQEKLKTNKLHETRLTETSEFDGKGKPGANETKIKEKLKSKEFKEKIVTGEAKPVNKPKLVDFVRSLLGFVWIRH